MFKQHAKLKPTQGRSQESLLRRLARDSRGNTLAMVGAAMVPLAGMIGSGVDMSRAYMVKNRLQAACDASALAARKVMTSNTVNATVTNEALKFFNFNYPANTYGTAPITPTVTKPRNGTVQVAAQTAVPTAIMKLFGFQTIPIEVTCEASQDFINVDLVLVLDVTGSMDETVNGEKKIVALREAVMSLYDALKPTQDLLEANGYRLRYAIVPYSQTVNVGKLLDRQYIRRTNTRTQLLKNPPDCAAWAQYSGKWYCTSYSVQSRNDVVVTRDDTWLNSAAWEGCVEERRTVVTTGNTPTATELVNMLDLNIDLVPTNDAGRWPPYDPAAHSIGLYNECPAEAVRLKTFTRGQMDNYVKTLMPVGNTYHDIGMIWGARMISDQGVFADSPLVHNGMRTNKYIVFLTDGQLAPNPIGYSSYGVEFLDGRITGAVWANPKQTGSTSTNAEVASLHARHQARFAAACREGRQRASVWVIAFAVGLDASMSSCANTNQARQSANKKELIDRFAEIAREVNELRVSR